MRLLTSRALLQDRPSALFEQDVCLFQRRTRCSARRRRARARESWQREGRFCPPARLLRAAVVDDRDVVVGAAWRAPAASRPADRRFHRAAVLCSLRRRAAGRQPAEADSHGHVDLSWGLEGQQRRAGAARHRQRRVGRVQPRRLHAAVSHHGGQLPSVGRGERAQHCRVAVQRRVLGVQRMQLRCAGRDDMRRDAWMWCVRRPLCFGGLCWNFLGRLAETCATLHRQHESSVHLHAEREVREGVPTRGVARC